MAKLTTVRCSYCEGRGVVDEDRDVPPNLHPCPVCERSGQLRVYSDYRRCNVCGGSGRKYDDMDPLGSFTRCKHCRGYGWVRPPPLVR